MSTEVEQSAQPQQPRHWIVSLQVFALGLMAGLLASVPVGLLCAIVAAIAEQQAPNVQVRTLHPVFRVLSSVVVVILTALAAYIYGIKSRRHLPIGYVFAGWLIWPVLTMPIFLLTRVKFSVAGVLWTLGTAVFYTLAAKWGEYNRPGVRR